MIRPSRRRQPSLPVNRELDVHLRLARARDRHRHLTISALVALAGALITWAMGLDFAVRALTVAAAAGAAWLVPLAGSDTWALRWIGRRTGLAYQTALETTIATTVDTTVDNTVESEVASDRYGMKGALLERAKESVVGVEEPRHSAWWLPVLALAAGALLLPALPNVSFSGPNVGGSQPANGSPVGTPERGDEDAEQQGEPELPEQERSRVDPGTAGAGADPGAADGDFGEDGAAGEREALERFLRNVRERPQVEREERQEPGGGAGDAQEGARRERTREAAEGDEPRAGDELRRGADEGSEDGQEGEDQGEGEQGAGEDPGNPFAEAGAEEPPEDGDESGESGEQGAGDEDRTPGAEESGEPGPGRADDGAGDEAGLGEGAGGQPSPERASEAGERREGETLFLEGDLRSGPITPGGTIQLPGSDDADLPEGAAPESYRREVERAVTEGRIPLEYQEIIRNYFR
ncbi:MAG: hypothetical protein WD314_01160 [Trueperaceae bacterium]